MNAAAAATRWQAPELRDPAPAPSRPTVAELAAIESAAHEEGFTRGHAEGFLQGQGEARRLAAQVAGILDAFSRPLAELDAEVREALGDLAVRIAGALVEHAYRVDPSLLAALVSRGVQLVGQGARAVEVRLHPDDLAAVQPLLAEGDANEWRMKPDPTLARGDVRVHTDTLRLDGTLNSRLQATLTTLLATGDAA